MTAPTESEIRRVMAERAAPTMERRRRQLAERDSRRITGACFDCGVRVSQRPGLPVDRGAYGLPKGKAITITRCRLCETAHERAAEEAGGSVALTEWGPEQVREPSGRPIVPDAVGTRLEAARPKWMPDGFELARHHLPIICWGTAVLAAREAGAVDPDTNAEPFGHLPAKWKAVRLPEAPAPRTRIPKRKRARTIEGACVYCGSTDVRKDSSVSQDAAGFGLPRLTGGIRVSNVVGPRCGPCRGLEQLALGYTFADPDGRPSGPAFVVSHRLARLRPELLPPPSENGPATVDPAELSYLSWGGWVGSEQDAGRHAPPPPDQPFGWI